MSKQVSVPKISLILQVKVSPKSDICPFCMKAVKSQCKLTKCPCYSFPFYLILEVVARLYNLKLYLDCNSIGKYNLMIQVDKCWEKKIPILHNVQFKKISIFPHSRDWNFLGVGDSVKPKNLKKFMKFNWNFQSSQGVGNVWIFSGTTQFIFFIRN